MKRNVCIVMVLVLGLAVLLPLLVQAEVYSLGETDMTLCVDDTMWYVFTRENIRDNPELEELGIPYEKIYDILYNNEAYMDATLFYEDGSFVEFFVRKRAVDIGVANLSNYDDADVLDLARGLAEKYNTDTYAVYNTPYKFARVEYFDATYGYYLCEFVTLVNKENYTLTFQSALPFTEREYQEIEEIVNSVQFDVDTSLKESKKSSLWDKVWMGALRGAIVGGVGGLIAAIVNKKKKKGIQKEEAGVCSDQEG